jgi:hypothetical protein
VRAQDRYLSPPRVVGSATRINYLPPGRKGLQLPLRGKGFRRYVHRTRRYGQNGGASPGTSPRQLEGSRSLWAAGLRPGLGMVRTGSRL